MVSSDNAPILHLVIDTVGFIKRAPILNIGKLTYTLIEVINEIRDKATIEYIKNSSFELILCVPTLMSLKIVTEIAKKTGDYASLSLTDLKVLALVHDLQIKHGSKDSINYDISIKNCETIEKTTLPNLEKRIGFFSDDSSNKEKADKKQESLGDENGSETDENNEGKWISQDNFDDALLKYNAGTVRPNVSKAGTVRIDVACLTTDFSIQNVLMHMKLNIVSLDGLMIKTLNSYVLRCRSCFEIITNMTKEFCRRCGNSKLDRVAVSRNDDGTMKLHIDFERLRVTRGFKHSIKKPKGGKHDLSEKICEDHQLPQIRMAKIKNVQNVDASPFMLNDVYSRSAIIGIRSLATGRSRLQQNPNQSAGGKRKKK